VPAEGAGCAPGVQPVGGGYQIGGGRQELRGYEHKIRINDLPQPPRPRYVPVEPVAAVHQVVPGPLDLVPVGRRPADEELLRGVEQVAPQEAGASVGGHARFEDRPADARGVQPEHEGKIATSGQLLSSLLPNTPGTNILRESLVPRDSLLIFGCVCFFLGQGGSLEQPSGECRRGLGEGEGGARVAQAGGSGQGEGPSRSGADRLNQMIDLQWLDYGALPVPTLSREGPFDPVLPDYDAVDFYFTHCPTQPSDFVTTPTREYLDGARTPLPFV